MKMRIFKKQKTLQQFVLILIVNFLFILKICSSQKIPYKIGQWYGKPFRWSRDAPITNSISGGKSQQDGGETSKYNHRNPNEESYHHQTKTPDANAVYTAHSGGSNTKTQMYNADYPPDSDNSINFGYAPSLSQQQGYYGPPTNSYYSPHSTSGVVGDFEPYMDYNQNKGSTTGMGGYSANSLSRGQNSQGWHINNNEQNPQNNNRYNNNRPLNGAEEQPVNYSAVGLLGLLALMGMIQHVMSDMDNSTTMSSFNMDDFESAMSISGGRPLRPPRPRPTTRPLRPRPTTMRPMSSTTAAASNPRPRIKRNPEEEPLSYSFPILLPNETISRLSEKMLPSYLAVARALDEKHLKGPYKECAIYHTWRIYRLLVNEFKVPEPIARLSVRHSLRMMQKKGKGIKDSSGFWKTWTKEEPKHYVLC